MAITLYMRQRPQDNPPKTLIGHERSCKCCQGRRYLIRKPLKSGVNLGFVEGTRREVVLKRDQNESSILLDLHHPNIIELQDLVSHEGFDSLVLNFCENGTLQDMIQKRKYLSASEASEILIKAAGAVKYLHNTAKVMHRDLVTQNILLDSTMNIKITGFKYASRLESPDDRMFDELPKHVDMAPEMSNGCGHDKRVDIWSLGILLMKMLFSPGSPECIEGRKLVSDILVQASSRPNADAIVMHPFVAGSFLPPEMDVGKRIAPPESSRNRSNHNASYFHDLCKGAGVGTDISGNPWVCVGAKKCMNPIRDENEGLLGDLGFKWAPL